MIKKQLLLCAPVSTRSGYGSHARDVFHALHLVDKYDIKILDVPWGDCPRNALDATNKSDKLVLDKIMAEPVLGRQPDIYIDLRIPNEFQTYGKINIGFTAGIETNAVSVKWIDSCNKMDLNIVPSEHSKRSFTETRFDKMEERSGQSNIKIGEITLEKPMVVVFEGVHQDTYKKLNVDEIDTNILDRINTIVKEDFAFLFVGQWVKGNYGEDRKDIFKLIKIFLESFANKKKQPALVLKTSGASFSVMDYERTIENIKSVQSKFPSDWNLPTIYLMHGDLTNAEMNSLYNHPKIKSLVTFTHGEGFGRPLLEASMVGLPIIASGWSGQMDFLDNERSLLLQGKLVQIPKSARWKDILIDESKWFTVDENHAYDALIDMHQNYFEYKRKADALMNINREKFTLEKMSILLDEVITQATDGAPSETKLVLPKLKKIKNGSSENSLKLPKLKRV
jgi:glycosyltransferase involved in cell wall biosynthesis